MDLFSELFGMFDGLDMWAQPQSQTSKDNKACPVCGRTWNDFAKTGRFGCGECYKTFRTGAERALRQAHSSSEHIGKVPSKSGAEIKQKRRLEELKRELKAAVAAENYEQAAKLHAEIKAIEGGKA